jgi:hypothetical protein
MPIVFDLRLEVIDDEAGSQGRKRRKPSGVKVQMPLFSVGSIAQASQFFEVAFWHLDATLGREWGQILLDAQAGLTTGAKQARESRELVAGVCARLHGATARVFEEQAKSARQMGNGKAAAPTTTVRSIRANGVGAANGLARRQAK